MPDDYVQNSLTAIPSIFMFWRYHQISDTVKTRSVIKKERKQKRSVVDLSRETISQSTTILKKRKGEKKRLVSLKVPLLKEYFTPKAFLVKHLFQRIPDNVSRYTFCKNIPQRMLEAERGAYCTLL